MIHTIILFIIGGAAAGFLAGLLGIGGGLVVVPFLAFFYPRIGIPEGYVMHAAVATSLTLIVATSASSIYGHYRQGGILWQVVKNLLPGILIGAALGAVIADLLHSSYLRIIFGVFVWIMAYRIGLQKSPPIRDAKPLGELPKRWIMTIHGVVISAFCTMLGTGGGSLYVPYFTFYKVPMRNAVATSASCGFPLAVAGVIGLMLAGRNEPGMPPGSIGYLYLPAFAAMVIPSVVLAPIGAKLAHRISVPILRRIFAVFLLIVGLDMLWKAILDFIDFI